MYNRHDDMFYSYKNFYLKLNNQDILITNGEVVVQNSIEPTYLSENRSSFDNITKDGINGNLRLTYYLT